MVPRVRACENPGIKTTRGTNPERVPWLANPFRVRRRCSNRTGTPLLIILTLPAFWVYKRISQVSFSGSCCADHFLASNEKSLLATSCPLTHVEKESIVPLKSYLRSALNPIHRV